MTKEQEPQDVCEMTPKCPRPPLWALTDVREPKAPKFKACDECMNQWVSDRFTADPLPSLPSKGEIFRG